MNKSWKLWISLNIAGWMGYELGKPQNEKTFLYYVNPFFKGVSTGIVSGVFPPLGIWYLYKEIRDW